MHKVLATLTVSLGVAAALSGSAMASDGGSARAATPPAAKVYTVAAGDSLSTIAATQQLDSWRPMWNANPQLDNPDIVYAGQQLTVPTGPTVDRPLPEAPVAAAQPVSTPGYAQTRSYSAQPTTYHVQRAAAPANYSAGAGGTLANIRRGESGGNYATNTGNGYYGAYQFTPGTWASVGGAGLPSNASPAEQDMRAQMLLSQRGCSPWPNTCR